VRRFAAALVCALFLCSAGQAQIPAFTPSMLMPSPLGIIITVGTWLFQDNKQVYYIRVRGEGATAEQARNNGFRLAVEQAVGTIVLSETETRNQRIVRDEIVTYASGFVDRFNILDTQATDAGYRVTMDVWVGESKISRRLLNESVGTGTVDGRRLSVQVETLKEERSRGDRVVETVIRDFPRRAFVVEVDRTQVDFTQMRSLNIEVPFRLSWSKEYVVSLTEALQVGSQSRVNCWVATTDCMARSQRQFHFNGLSFDEPHKLVAMINHFGQNKPTLQLRILDLHGRSLYQICQSFLFTNLENQPYHMPSRWMFEVHDKSVRLDTRYQLTGKLGLNLPDTRGLERAERVEVRIVTQSECTKT
jgi:hypothetical protein